MSTIVVQDEQPAPAVEIEQPSTEEIEAQTEQRVEIIEAETEARVAIIEAEAEAQAEIIEAQAEAAVIVEEARAENNDTWRMEMMTQLEAINSRLTALEATQSTLSNSPQTESNSTPKSISVETENPSLLEAEISVGKGEAARETPKPQQAKRREIFL